MVKACKKLCGNTDKRALKEAHRIKMEMKRLNRELAYGKHKPSWVRANLGIDHPDYGDSVEGHAKQKAERLKNNT